MQPPPPFMLMLQLYSYLGQTPCWLEGLSFWFSNLQRPLGESLKQYTAFVKEQREVSAGCGVRGALWETRHSSIQTLAWVFFVPGMQFPPHSLSWLLVTFRQQHARFGGGPGAELRDAWLSQDM